jgi:GWxTD domain-containing protein
MSQNRLRVVALASSLLVAGAAVAAVAPLAEEKLSKNDKNWVEKEVGALITAQEKATFEQINKDDRKLFKDLFWMRRDFNPTTSDNEFQRDYEARVKAADENFRGGGTKGSESDMGRIFLLLGGPNQQRRGEKPGGGPGAQPSADPGSGGEDPGSQSGLGSPGGGEGEDAQTMTWVYDPNPALGIPNGISVPFRQQAGFGYRMVTSDELTKQLERVKERLVANPAVNYARDENGRLRKADMKFDPNSPAKLALKALQETGQTSEAIAFEVSPSFFRASGGQIYVPLDFVLGSGLNAAKAMVFGSVLTSDGITVYQFEETAEIATDAAGRQVWEMPLQVQPGAYKLYLGIMDEAGTTTGTKIVDLEVPDLSTTDLQLSSILMFSEGKQIGEAMGSPGRAFLLGGYHFTPKREMVYTSKDQLSGVFYAYNYGVEGDKPNLTVHLSFSKEGEGRGATKDEPFMLQVAEMALTIFDIPLSIPNFKEPGNYKVTVKVTDHVTKKTITQEIPFQVQAQ